MYGVGLVLTIACTYIDRGYERYEDEGGKLTLNQGTIMTIASIALPRWASYSPVRLSLPPPHSR